MQATLPVRLCSSQTIQKPRLSPSLTRGLLPNASASPSHTKTTWRAFIQGYITRKRCRSLGSACAKHKFGEILQPRRLVLSPPGNFCNTTRTILSALMNYEIRLFRSPLNIYTASLRILILAKWAVKTVCSDSPFFFLPEHHLELKKKIYLSAACTGDTGSPYISSLYTVDILDIA